MDLNLLTTFLSVYKNRSITLAADELDVSQPAVSASLKRLEAVVGKPLYVREGRGIAPTGAAVALANKIQSPMSVLETVQEKQEQLNLYCSEMVLHKVSHIQQMHTVVTPLNEQEVIDDLNTQKVDLVIDAMVTKQNSLLVEQFHQEDGVCLTRKDHPRIGETLTREQYFAEQHIALKIRRNNMGTLDHITTEQLETRKVSIETESVASMISLAAITDYVGASTRSFAETFAPILNLNVHPLPFDVKPISLSLLYHRRFANDPFHKAKRNELVEAITGFKHK